MREIRDIFKIYGVVLVLLLVILPMRLFGGYITAICLFCIYILFALPLKRYFNMNARLIVIFSGIYAIFAAINEAFVQLSDFCIYILPLFFFYCLGEYFTDKLRSINNIYTLILCLILSYCGVFFYATIKDILFAGTLINPARGFLFQEDSPSQFGSTPVGTCISIALVGLPAFFIIRKQRTIRFLYILVFMLSLITTIHLLNRSGIIEFFTVVCVYLCYRYKFGKPKLLESFLYVLIIITVVYYINNDGNEILTYYQMRNESTDFGMDTAGGRTSKWSEGLLFLFKYPFGWYNSENALYDCHNMWLDVAKRGGLIAFILLLILTIRSILNLKKLYYRNNKGLSLFFIILNICFLESCFIEPVYGGTHMALLFMLWGMQDYLATNFNMKTI